MTDYFRVELPLPPMIGHPEWPDKLSRYYEGDALEAAMSRLREAVKALEFISSMTATIDGQIHLDVSPWLRHEARAALDSIGPLPEDET